MHAPNKVWVTDITYLATSEGWLYLAIVLELYSRKIVGWIIRKCMTKELVIDALEGAIKRRNPAPGLICHSDRGSQYCSHAYRELLQKHGFLCSMSRKGECQDNACAETFFHSMKVEWIYGEPLKSRDQMKQAIRDTLRFFTIGRDCIRIMDISHLVNSKELTSPASYCPLRLDQIICIALYLFAHGVFLTGISLYSGQNFWRDEVEAIFCHKIGIPCPIMLRKAGRHHIR